MFSVNRRTLILLVLLVVPLFYAIGTGFDFLYTLLYVILLLFAVGALWVWVNLQGLEIRVSRSGDRGQVGGYLEGRITVVNRTVIPSHGSRSPSWSTAYPSPAAAASHWTGARPGAGASRLTWRVAACSRAGM